MNHSIDQDEINHAAQVVKNGGVVAFPTDTFYGLGCDPFNARAVDRIFEIKQRPGAKAILLLIDSLEALDLLVPPLGKESRLGKQFLLLREQFWPGPLTIVLPALAGLPVNLVSPTRTIGIRYPNYKFAIEFIRAAGGVVTATSANLSGRPNTETADQVRTQLGSSLDYILDGGKSPGGEPSTVIDLTSEPPQLVREGAIPRSALAPFLV